MKKCERIQDQKGTFYSFSWGHSLSIPNSWCKREILYFHALKTFPEKLVDVSCAKTQV